MRQYLPEALPTIFQALPGNMWVLLWIQLATVNTPEYFHVGTYSSIENCNVAKKKASVLVVNSSSIVACLDVTLEGSTN